MRAAEYDLTNLNVLLELGPVLICSNLLESFCRSHLINVAY